jgi:hypothetical protein
MTKNLWISLGVKKAATWCITSSGTISNISKIDVFFQYLGDNFHDTTAVMVYKV